MKFTIEFDAEIEVASQDDADWIAARAAEGARAQVLSNCGANLKIDVAAVTPRRTPEEKILRDIERLSLVTG